MPDTSSLAESILEQMGDALIYADEKGTIRRWNRAAAASFHRHVGSQLGIAAYVYLVERHSLPRQKSLRHQTVRTEFCGVDGNLRHTPLGQRPELYT